MRILLVEDEARMAQAIKRGLRGAAYAVDVARDGEDALYQASINEYDAVILDVMIPRRNGFEVNLWLILSRTQMKREIRKRC